MSESSMITNSCMLRFQFDNVATGSSLSISALEKDGQAWFVANDVCNALGLHRTATRRLDEDEKGVHKTHTLGGLQEVAIINESGLYSLIFSSNKAAAKVFKKWVTSVVIPSIRTNGGYINGQEALPAEQQAETIQVIQQEAQRVGLCAIEEREARYEALKFLGSGRRRTKRKLPRMRPPEDPGAESSDGSSSQTPRPAPLRGANGRPGQPIPAPASRPQRL